MIEIKELHREHPLVKVAYMMVQAHSMYPSMTPAIEDVMDEFPSLDMDIAIAMWIAINAKDRTDKGADS